MNGYYNALVCCNIRLLLPFKPIQANISLNAEELYIYI